MITQKKIAWIAAFIALLLLFSAAFLSSSQKKMKLPTYFVYSEEEIETLSIHPLPGSHFAMRDVMRWQYILFNHIKDKQIDYPQSSNIYAYFFTAMRDAAFLSYNLHGNFVGSLDPLCIDLLCLFFPSECSETKNHDPYSKAIANLVLAKVKTRISQDMQARKNYPEKQGGKYWLGKKPYIGLDAGSWKTWLIQSGSRLRSLPPPPSDDPEWQNQLNLVKEAVKAINSEQKKTLIYWNGGPGTPTLSGIWLETASHYLENTSLEKTLFAQSILAMALADAIITAFDSVYTYWTKRPFMLDPTLKTVISVPNYPGYPSSYSTVSYTAAKVLTFFFPKEKKCWMDLAYEAAQSRIWGGINFPIDIEHGKIQGEELGDAIYNFLTKKAASK